MGVPKSSAYFLPVVLVAGLLATVLGALLLLDRPGLEVEYYAGTPESFQAPAYRGVGQPQLMDRGDVAGVLVSQEIFTLRWRGWLRVAEKGEYRFQLDADEASYLKLDGLLVAETSKGSRSHQSAPLVLSAGVHAVEIEFSQTGGKANFESSWWRVGEKPRQLRGSDLLARHPARLRALVRGVPWVGTGIPARVLGLLLMGFGLALCVKGFGCLQSSSRSVADNCKRWLQSPQKRKAVVGGFLLILFVAACAMVFPFTASTTDGDDVRYMDGARFNKQMGWNMNRYGHIYLLKAFIWISDGDAFLASRIHWAFAFGMTVLALAWAVVSLGAGLQMRTLAVVLFLLIAQSYLFIGIGASYAEYSAMMFVTLGIAVYLHGSRSGRSPTSIHLIALGALSVAAAKSKEPGLIMLWLAFALLWNCGRFDGRGFSRRIAWWAAGAGAAYLLLMSLDALVLGDFWFSLRLESVAGAKRLKDAAVGIWQLPPWAWLDVAWTRGPMRNLSILAIVAVIMAMIRRLPTERRLIAMMPLAFMAMMIAVHPAISSARYLLPIVPAACLAGALMLYDLGLSASSWRGLLSLRTLIILVCLSALFGAGWQSTWSGLTRHRAVQKGDWTLYPWQVFELEIKTERPKEILVSPRLYRTYQMTGQSKTRDRIARLYFQRRHLKLVERRSFGGSKKVAIVSWVDYKRWLRTEPEIEERALFDPSGQIALVRPE